MSNPMGDYYAALMKSATLRSQVSLYDSGDPTKLSELLAMAERRDNRLTDAERKAKEEAIRVCILGDHYWLRAHP